MAGRVDVYGREGVRITRPRGTDGVTVGAGFSGVSAGGEGWRRGVLKGLKFYEEELLFI